MTETRRWTTPSAFIGQNPATLCGLKGWISSRQPNYDGVIAYGSATGPKSRARLIRTPKHAMAYQMPDGGSLEPGVEVQDRITGRHGYFGGIFMDGDGEFYFELRRWPGMDGKRGSHVLSIQSEGELLDRLKVRFVHPYCDFID